MRPSPLEADRVVDSDRARVLDQLNNLRTQFGPQKLNLGPRIITFIILIQKLQYYF